MDNPKYELHEATAKGYAHVKGAPPVFYKKGHGHIDIRTLTPEKAAALVKAGCPHLVAIEPKEEKPAAKAPKATGAES